MAECAQNFPSKPSIEYLKLRLLLHITPQYSAQLQYAGILKAGAKLEKLENMG